MPKLQFFTANLLDEENKVIPERIPKTSYSNKSITVKSDIPKSGKFKLRLSSGPIPFDLVVKLFLDGFFLSGRCFLSGDVEPICDYEITNDRYPGIFQFQRPFSRVQVTVHRCFLGNHFPCEPLNRPHFSNPSSSFSPGLPILNDWMNIPPVILHEEPQPWLSITWDCSRPDAPKY